VAAKAQAALKAGITPIACVGETLDERDRGVTESVVLRQLDAVLSTVASEAKSLVVAYEPVWAIGTGRTASPAEAQAVHATLRARLREGAGRETTFRAAPGRLRVEVRTAGSGGARSLLALAGPGARHDERGVAHGPEGPAECPACAGDTLLREAAYEPRNLLAHAAERGAVPAAASDGAIEIALPAEGLVYRFDRATGLCARRIDPRRGVVTHYGGWRRVGGVATPFLEIDETPDGVFERRVLAVAYDLPLFPALAPIMM